MSSSHQTTLLDMTKHLGTFRIDLDLWSQFKTVTAGEGSSASAEIIDFITRYLAGYRLPSSSSEEPSSSSIEALIDAHLAPVKQQLLDIEARLAAVQQASSSSDRQPSSKPKPVRQQKRPSEDDQQDAPIDVVGQPVDLSKGLLQNDLCRRLKVVGHTRLSKNRRLGASALAMYTRQRDPDGKAWGYRDGRYYPVD